MPFRRGLTIRRATEADLDRVMKIAGNTPCVSHWSRATYEKYQSEPREGLFHRFLLIADADQGVTGFAAGTFLEGDDMATLENLAVDAEWRRQGVAKALAAEVMEWAKSEGASGLELEVRISNEAAQALYRSLRFAVRGRRSKYYSEPEEDALLMVLKFE